MRPIRQTRFGQVLCWLGIHQLVWGQQNREDWVGAFSLSGGCVRCNKSFGWDG